MTTPFRTDGLQTTPTGIVGPPTTGTHAKGEQSTDSNGLVWYCTESGTPGVWASGGGGSPIVWPPRYLYVNENGHTALEGADGSPEKPFNNLTDAWAAVQPDYYDWVIYVDGYMEFEEQLVLDYAVEPWDKRAKFISRDFMSEIWWGEGSVAIIGMTAVEFHNFDIGSGSEEPAIAFRPLPENQWWLGEVTFKGCYVYSGNSDAIYAPGLAGIYLVDTEVNGDYSGINSPMDIHGYSAYLYLTNSAVYGGPPVIMTGQSNIYFLSPSYLILQNCELNPNVYVQKVSPASYDSSSYGTTKVGSNESYFSIQGAINAVPTWPCNWIIQVAAGRYNEDITVTDKAITIIGEGKDATFIYGKLQLSTGTILRDVFAKNTNTPESTVTVIDGSGLVATGCQIESYVPDVDTITILAPEATVIIEDCLIQTGFDLSGTSVGKALMWVAVCPPLSIGHDGESTRGELRLTDSILRTGGSGVPLDIPDHIARYISDDVELSQYSSYQKFQTLYAPSASGPFTVGEEVTTADGAAGIVIYYNASPVYLIVRVTSQWMFNTGGVVTGTDSEETCTPVSNPFVMEKFGGKVMNSCTLATLPVGLPSGVRVELFCDDLGVAGAPIYWNGSIWVKADGTPVF